MIAFQVILITIHANAKKDMASKIVQVNLLFSHQITRNMTKDCSVQYMKTTSSEHVVYINCSECQNKKQFVCTTCSPHVLSL